MSEQTDKQKEWSDRELGALWKKRSNAGLDYYSGKIKIDGKEYDLVCYANKDKKSDNQPDVRIYKATPKN